MGAPTTAPTKYQEATSGKSVLQPSAVVVPDGSIAGRVVTIASGGSTGQAAINAANAGMIERIGTAESPRTLTNADSNILFVNKPGEDASFVLSSVDPVLRLTNFIFEVTSAGGMITISVDGADSRIYDPDAGPVPSLSSATASARTNIQYIGDYLSGDRPKSWTVVNRGAYAA